MINDEIKVFKKPNYNLHAVIYVYTDLFMKIYEKCYVSTLSNSLLSLFSLSLSLSTEHSYKHIILVVLHHTFDSQYIAPDSRHSVHRSDVFAVDCLYYEDQGLLDCRSNDEALKRVIKHLGGENSSRQVCEVS